jgi:hypothetical protein
LSPAGTAALQWTRDAPPGVPEGVAPGLEEGVAGALEVLIALGLGECFAVAGEPPQAESARAATTTTGLRRTAVTVSA